MSSKNKKNMEKEEKQETQAGQETVEQNTAQQASMKEETASCPEQEAPEQEAASQAQEPQQPDEAQQLQKQLDELNDRYLRTLAEYDNFRKRSQREKLEIYPDAVASTIEKFLPALDNFERALAAPCSDEEFKKGVEMIFHSLMDCLKALNVEEIEAMGKPFDPNLHNAVMHVEDENLGENTVAQVFQKGYKIGDKVLRHAMVQVAN